ncbi:MAG TPA: hypothetical protein VHG32_00005 [Thermoanaerobaculia bacterium]|jgi:cellulose biosynthesis protein BcsQ|nr:hypothetical protein [Thermoanaerobaculia bacterium]
MEFTQEKRPSGDPEVLCAQLLRELHRLREGIPEQEEPLLYQVYCSQMLAATWRRVARGDLGAPGTFLSHLGGARAFVGAFFSPLADYRAEAARHVHHLLLELALAGRSVRPSQVKARLSDRRRSASEREVLRVLLEHGEQYLRRGEVYELIQRIGGENPSASIGKVRVGQILVDLHHEGLLLRAHASARGNPSAAFYSLSDAGRKVCQELEIGADLPPLFHLPANIETQILKPEKVAMPAHGFSRDKRQIATFYSYRGGLGRSLAVANCGRELAKRSEDEPALLIDMDLEAPGLNEYFPVPEGTAGFEGLLDGYFSREEKDRSGWLTEALRDRRFVVQLDDYPNLLLLPSTGATAATRGAGWATSQLEREVAAARDPSDGRPRLPQRSFLADFRAAVHSRFARALIDAPAGLGPVSYACTALLADELVLCLRPNGSSAAGLRKVVATHLWRDRRKEEWPLITFVVTPFPLGSRQHPVQLIESELLTPPQPYDASSNRSLAYRVVRLYYNDRLACSSQPLARWRDQDQNEQDWLLQLGYKDLARLIGASIAGPDLPGTMDEGETLRANSLLEHGKGRAWSALRSGERLDLKAEPVAITVGRNAGTAVRGLKRW